MSKSRQLASSSDIDELLRLYARKTDEIRDLAASLDNERQLLVNAEKMIGLLQHHLQSGGASADGIQGETGRRSGEANELAAQADMTWKAELEAALRHAENRATQADLARNAEREAALRDVQSRAAQADRARKAEHEAALGDARNGRAYELALIDRLASVTDELARARAVIAELTLSSALSGPASRSETEDVRQGNDYERALINRLASMNDELGRAKALNARLTLSGALSVAASEAETQAARDDVQQGHLYELALIDRLASMNDGLQTAETLIARLTHQNAATSPAGGHGIRAAFMSKR